MRRRLATRSANRRWGPISFSLHLYSLPLPTLYGGWELNHVWFGIALGGTPADDVISLGLAFDLPPRIADLAWRAADAHRAAVQGKGS